MKKWLYCVLILAGLPMLGFAGFGGKDVGKLSPVQVVEIAFKDDLLQLRTDTGALGKGEDITQAIDHLKQTAPAEVFLDTADYLLIRPGSEYDLPELYQHLRPSCYLCYVTDEVDLELAGKYLRIHEPTVTMAQYEAGERRLPYLISEEGGLKLVQP